MWLYAWSSQVDPGMGILGQGCAYMRHAPGNPGSILGWYSVMPSCFGGLVVCLYMHACVHYVQHLGTRDLVDMSRRLWPTL